jgi:hypothetical protein
MSYVLVVYTCIHEFTHCRQQLRGWAETERSEDGVRGKWRHRAFKVENYDIQSFHASISRAIIVQYSVGLGKPNNSDLDSCIIKVIFA